MAVTFSITRNTTRFHDSNGNGIKDAGETDLDFGEVGVYDPGDVLYTRITITNTGDQDATGVTLEDTFLGSTFVDAANGNPGTTFINISPIARNDTFEAIGNTVLRVGTANTINNGESTFFAGNVTTNDIGSLGADSIPGFQIDAVTNGVSVNGGKFNIFADGTFNYVNDGTDVTLTTDSFNYTIRDKGFDGTYGTADDLTSVGKVTITFAPQSAAPGAAAHRVWYVDSNAGPGGDGTSANPFQTMAQINGLTGDGTTGDDLDKAGEYIYVENGAGAPVTGPITLEDGQQLIGDGAALVVAGATLATAGANSTLTAATGTIVTLASGNTIAGLNIGNDTGTAGGITGTNFGTLTVNNVSINADGQALSLTNGTFQGTGFTSTDSDTSTTTNVSLVDVTGTVALGTGALAGAATNAINIANTSGAPVNTGLTYGGTVTHSGTGALLNVDGGVQGHTGTVALTGGLTASGASTGFNFENADGTYTFNTPGVSSLSGTNVGIDIVSNTAGNAAQGSAGSFTFGDTMSIASSGGSALVVTDSTAAINFGADVTHTGNSAALDVTNHSTGTFQFQTTSNWNVTNGTGLQFSNADGIYNMNNPNVLNGGDAGIDIDTGSSGSFTFISNTSITNPTGDALVIDNSTATVSFGGSITDNSGRVVNINQHDSTNNITFTTTSSITATNGSSGILIQESGTGGTIAFNGQVQLTTSTQNAITLTNNSGKTINFNADDAGLDISTTSGSGIVASNGGTITIGDVGNGNTINVTAGAAGTVAFSATGGTTIGAGGVTFDSINQSGGTNGIVLNGTGTGAFTVLGDGSQTSGLYDRDGSGGTISGTTGHAVALTSASNVTLRQMNLTNPGGDAVNSTGGGSIKLQAVNIDAGGGDGWQAVNLGGANEFTHNSRVTDWQVNNTFGITVTNTDTNFTSFTVQNALFTTSATGADGFLFDANGATSGSITVNNSEFTLIDQDAVQINNDGSGTINARVNNNNFHDADATAGDGNNTVFLALGGSGTLNFEVINNDFTNLARSQALTGALAVNAATIGQTGSRLNGFIDNNDFTNIERRDAISFGLEASGGAQGNHTIVVNNNRGTDIGLTHLRVILNSVDGGSIGGFNLAYTNNTFSDNANSALVTDDSRSGIDIETNFASTNGAIDGFTTGGDITSTFLFQNNNISSDGSASGVSDTIDITNRGGAAGTNGTMNLTFLGNTFTNTTGAFGIDILNSPGTQNGAGATLNLDMNSDNISPNNTTTTNGAGGDITVRNNATAGVFRIEDLGANAVTTFLSTRNSNDTVTNNTTGAAITSTGDVTMPTAPTAFIVTAAPPAPPADAVEPVDGGLIDTPEVGNGAPVAAPAPAPAETPAPAPAGPVVVEDGILSQAELDLLVDAAIARWAAAGATEAQIAAMRSVSVSVTDLAGLTLGQSNAGTIVLDNDAAGWRWFVDSTPGDDSEYAGSGTRLAAVNPDGLAGTRIDLLTVLTHELGHQIGLSDSYGAGEADELMYGTINAGERRLPGSDDLDHAADGPVTGAFAFAPITLGTVPAGQTVVVEFRHVINAPAEDGLVGPWTGKTIIDSDQTDPQDSNTETGAVDSLTLGDRVFIDSNEDGNYDAGEGVAGVSVSLYADTNNSGGWDSGDAQVGVSQLTGAGGLYSFAGLAPGDYIVVVNGSSFDSGQPLNGKVSIAGEADPNNNVDNDDNGVAGIAGLGAGIASQAIRLDYGLEPTDDGDSDSDTNLTLDFGFFAPNQAPVIGALNGDSATYYENGAAIPIDVGQNATVTDSDSANFDGGSLTLQVTGSTGDRIVWGPAATFDGDNKVYVGATHIGQLSTAGNQIIVTLNANATPANIQTLIRNFLFDVNSETPVAGTRTFTFTLVDGDGNDGGLGNDTGSASSTIEVVPVSDAPVGADRTGTGLFDSTGATYAFTVADFATGFTDPNDDPANSFSGVKITTLPSASAGTIYYDSNLADATPAVAIAAGDTFTAQDLTDGKLTFVGAAGSGGTAMSFTFQVIDNGSTANGGVVMDATPNTFSTTIIAGNSAPVVDLDADDSNTVGTGFTSSYVEGGAAAISDTDVTITDADSGDDIVSATITITNAVAGDKLSVGTLPTGVTVDPSSTDTMLKLVAAAGTSADDFEAAIEAVQFENTGNDPTAGGNTSRTITVTVNDGTSESAAATATVSVTGTNDSPDGTDATITATEDTFRILSAGDFGFSDPDSADSMSAVTITAVNGSGQLYYDADGTAGAGAPVAVTTFPQTYTVSELAAGNVSYRAPADANGNALATIDFQVVDSGAAGNSTDPVGNILTVNVTAVNDAPVLTTDSPIAAIEQTAVAILPAGSVVDVELDARNGGNGDYAGAQFSVNRNSAASTDDIFTLVDGANFTVDGINLKTTGGQIFGQISANNPGLIVISFNSSQAIATSALVDEVIQSVRYTNISDNPPASVDLAVGLTDGSTGGGQGTVIPGQTLDVNVVTVDIEAVNDAPVNSLGGTIGTGEDAVDAWLSGMSITDPDIDPATEAMLVKFEVANGTLEIRTDVVGGIVAGDVTYPDVGVISVLATLDKINATLAATNGLTYTPNANFNGDDTLTVTTNDRGWDGTDPGLSGDHISEEDIDTRTITVSAVDDAAVAQDDDVSTLENAVKTGDLFANNGSGADFDVEDDPFSITKVTVNGTDYAPGTEIDLPSGAKLTVNADGTYSYNPNGKFTKLTDGSSGAVNTSAEDIFSYTVTGGDTAIVTMTVNGVAGPGDWLMGDSGDNTIVGTPEPDFFFVSQGGDDDVSGLGSNDGFYFGAALTVGDVVDGGAGLDELSIQGDYTGANALTLGDVTNVEVLVILPGNDARFGDDDGNAYSYDITTADENVAAGGILYVDAARLRTNENLTFDGSAEADGRFYVYGGRGTDTITGGDQADLFLFRGTGKFTAADTLNGGGGLDELALRGDYTGANKVVFGTGTITDMEAIVVISGHDLRYGLDIGDVSYDLKINDGNLASGQLLIVDGGTLRAGESLSFDGSAETDGGKFKIFGGKGDDVLRGGTGNDVIRGGLGQDTQTGGGGDDRFVFTSAADSTLAVAEGIGDFSVGDLLDLSAIDAKTGVPGNDTFTFIGTDNFNNQAGEVRAVQYSGPIWQVQADIDGDGAADLNFFVTTDHNLVITDFVL